MLRGSILGPLLFLIFINDLPLFLKNTIFSADLYADDTTVYDAQFDLNELKANLQKSLIVLRKWCKQNGMLLNTDKTKVMLITTRQKRIHINENILSFSYNDVELQITTEGKKLGVNIDENLIWNNHYQFVCKKVSSYIWLLSRISHFLSTEHKLLYHKSYIQPHFYYCNVIWGNASNFYVARITRLQRRACKLILGNEYIDFESAKSSLKILSFEQSVFLNDVELQITTEGKILGVNIDENLIWNNHYQFVCKKVSSYIWLLSRISHFLSTEHKLLYHKSYIQPHFYYCNVIWGNASNFYVARITRLQRRACKLILGNEYIDFESAKSSLKILSFEQSVFLNKAKVMFKVANGLVPQYISDMFKRRSEIAQNTSLRSITNENFTIPKPSLALYKESISYSGPVVWNSIPNEIRVGRVTGNTHILCWPNAGNITKYTVIQQKITTVYL